RQIIRAVDDVVGAVGKVAHIASTVGGAVGKVGSFFGIHGATGGIVTSPTFALIGEAGPEAVIPLNQAPGAYPLGAPSAGGGLTLHVTVQGSVVGSGGMRELTDIIYAEFL